MCAVNPITCGMAGMLPCLSRSRGPLRVKSGKAQNKQMFSGLHRKADTRAFVSTRPTNRASLRQCRNASHIDLAFGMPYVIGCMQVLGAVTEQLAQSHRDLRRD